MEFGDTSPDAGRQRTDDGDQRDRRQLKHHPKGDTRTAPMCPELAKLLRWHTEEFGYSPGGKLFTGIEGGELPTVTIRRSWVAARAAVMTGEEQASPLAKRIYDLRSACLSL